MEVVDCRETITHKHSKQVRPAFFMPSLALLLLLPTVLVVLVEYKTNSSHYNKHGKGGERDENCKLL